MKWKPNNILNRLIRMKKSDEEAYLFAFTITLLTGILLGLDLALMAVLLIN